MVNEARQFCGVTQYLLHKFKLGWRKGEGAIHTMPILLMIILFVVGIPLIVLGGGAIFVHGKVKQVEDFAYAYANPEETYQEYIRQLELEHAAATWTPMEVALVAAILIAILVLGFIGWRISQNQDGFEY